ncbi:hypothetical protein FIBSPDRAFT_928731 [Athelia psychrophila]|uniref:DUF6534 domain-containing protein n=1 Tax=Athelia psychrophila TaxID=1759441 RepID=A0A166PP57_9AGAM|nr:hypothetical protein FIBSPDRAFT_928731 [Fibularhizoctonia sp. CBS 109695]
MTSLIAAPFGLILIGVFLSLMLLGIVISQVFTYYQNYERDPLWLKWFVAVMFALDLLSSVLAIAWMYQLLIDNWGQIAAFTQGDWLLAADPMLAGIVACMAQCFFAWRIYVLTSSRWLTAIIACCAVVTACGGIGTGIAVLWVKKYTLFLTFKQITVLWLVSAAVGAIGITISLTYHLRRRKGSFEATDKVLDRIIQLTIQNGFFTAIVAITDVCMYLAVPLPYHMALSFLMPKLYSNTILSSLNARKDIRRDLANVVDCGGRTTIRTADVVKFGGTSSSPATTRPEIFVEVHEMTMSDAKVDADQAEWVRASEAKVDAEQPEWNRV